MQKLPSLKALRAFEAAARHMSFSAAANELAVTPAALSFQIKNLEEHLGAPLFIRLNRAVALTPFGQDLAPDVSSAFSDLSHAWQRVRHSVLNKRFTVTAGPAFTSKWLAPRLTRFSRLNPEVELMLSASLSVLDFVRDGIDLAIQFGVPHESERYFHEYLMKDWVLPVTRPEVALGLRKPEDFLKIELIRDESLSFLKEPPSWRQWFMKAGVAVEDLKTTTFNQADHAVDMVSQGQGAALARYSVAYHGLETGALVAPFSIFFELEPIYRIRCLKGEESKPLTILFREWLHEEVTRIKQPFNEE